MTLRGVIVRATTSQSPSHIRHQLVASLVARILTGGLQFVFTPVYLGLLGPENYGLIGFYLALFGLVSFLDQAVTPIVVRRFAHAGTGDPSTTGIGDVFRTMELVSVAIAITVFVVIALFSDRIAADLLHRPTSSAADTATAVLLIAAMIAVQWPSLMYAGALSGAGQQVPLNLTRGVVAVAQYGGGALLLSFVAADIHWLFGWQVVCFAIQTLVFRRLATRTLVETQPSGRFRLPILTASWRFSVGTLVIGLTGSILTQADKLLVSRFEELDVFTAYSLAFTVASLVQVFVAQPVMAIAFPRFSKSFAIGDDVALSSEYRRWTQAIVAVVMPLTAVLVFFPEQVLTLWLHGHAETVRLAATYLPWVAGGTMLNVVMMLPFNLQLASGWTSLSSIKNVVLLPLFLVALHVGIPREGPIVGAMCWCAVNFAYFLFEVPVMHGRLLRTVMWSWWLCDTIAPAAGAAVVCLVVKSVVLQDAGAPALVSGAAWLATTVLLVLTLEYPRQLLFGRAEADGTRSSARLIGRDAK